MKIIGCDLHARQQTIAMLDTDTGEFGSSHSQANARRREKIKGQPTQAAPLQSLLLDSCYFAGVAVDHVHSPVHV
jgi:hypothetical protein